MKVSIIIPTQNRCGLLAEAIDSLVNQSLDKTEYEILIVDNCSTDSTKSVVERFAEETDGLVTYLYEERPGSHFARNGAVKHAKGEYLYFTDDDILAEKDMLKNLIAIFDTDERIATATGPVRPRWLAIPPDWVLYHCNNYLLSLNELPNSFFMSECDPGVYSCHQLIKKSVFIEAGGYNPDIVNGEWVGDNETGLNIKIRKLGYLFAYTGNALIYHQIPASRMTQAYLNRRLANQGNSDSFTDYREHIYSTEELKQKNKEFRMMMIKKWLRALLLRCVDDDNWHIKLAQAHYYKHRTKYNSKLLHNEQWRNYVLKGNWLE